MKYDGDYGDHDKLVTFDIETTHYDPDRGETVAIGVGQHDVGSPEGEARYETFARRQRGLDDERQLVERAFEFIDRLDGDTLVSYNGVEFDMDFLYKRQPAARTTSGPRWRSASTATTSPSRRPSGTVRRSITLDLVRSLRRRSLTRSRPVTIRRLVDIEASSTTT